MKGKSHIRIDVIVSQESVCFLILIHGGGPVGHLLGCVSTLSGKCYSKPDIILVERKTVCIFPDSKWPQIQPS